MNKENDLLLRANELDADVLADIFDSYYDPIYRYIYYHIYHTQTAEDLASQVFQRLLERIHAGQGPKQHLKAWLFRVAHNLIVDDSRRQQHRNHAPLMDDLPAPSHNIEEQIATAQLTKRAYTALAQLSDKQRSIIILRYLMDMTPTEIAEILDVSVGSIKALQHRGLDALRRELNFTPEEEIENEQ